LTAADKLRGLLSQLDNASSLSPSSPWSSSSKTSSDVPTLNELYFLVQAADQISHRLRVENDVLHDDNIRLQSHIITLIEEINRLHEEIRSTFISDMFRLINIDDERPMTNKESQILDLYTRKMRSLEIELKDAKEKLNMYESLWYAPNDRMNCLKCGVALPCGQYISTDNEKYTNIIM
ncbi:unnamed protein product, partial [Rotaria sp. Silwood1]